jgi:hypothetical protein
LITESSISTFATVGELFNLSLSAVFNFNKHCPEIESFGFWTTACSNFQVTANFPLVNHTPPH